MGVIAALLPDASWQQRVQAAVRDRHEVVPCGDWAGLLRTCGAEAVVLAIFDLYAEGDLDLEPLRTLRRRFPRITQVAYVRPTADRARDLFDAGRAGIDAVVIADRDDTPALIRATVDLAEARAVAGVVREHLDSEVALVRDAVLISVTRAHEQLDAERLARLLHLSRRSLADQLGRAGFPAPQRLLAWGRLIVAAHLLEDPSRSAEGVALALDYPSGSAFRNSCQRYLHATPHEIRANGGARFAVRGLMAEAKRPIPT
ncbi:MAG: helix-turn-helix transcriptional regulator [Gemmatimonadetes bacterium]|nr:helix-turn-helix transcriptional regulator [Gemmatimonadota bacterium]